MTVPVSIYAYYSVAVAFFIILAIAARRIYIKSEDRAYRYRFFAFRDRLIWLAVNDRVSQDSRIYRFLYSYLNAVIPFVEVLNWSCVATVADRELTPEDKALLEEVLAGRPEVRTLVRDVFMTTRDLMKEKKPTAMFVGEFWSETWHGSRMLQAWLTPYKVAKTCERLMETLDTPQSFAAFGNGAVASSG